MNKEYIHEIVLYFFILINFVLVIFNSFIAKNYVNLYKKRLDDLEKRIEVFYKISTNQAKLLLCIFGKGKDNEDN